MVKRNTQNNHTGANAGYGAQLRKMLAAYEFRVYDACGSGGMFLQPAGFVATHQKNFAAVRFLRRRPQADQLVFKAYGDKPCG